MAVTPAYGLLAFGAPPNNAGDDRYWDLPTASANYEVVTDASFDDGLCHKFANAATSDQMIAYFVDCGSGATQNIDMAVGDEFRVYAETEWTKTGVNVMDAMSIGGGASAGVRFLLNTGKLYVRGYIQQANVAESVTSDYEISSTTAAVYREIEWGIKRTGTSEYQLILRVDGVLKETLTRTILDGSNMTACSSLRFGHGVDSGKAVTCDVRYGRYAVSWNNGTISRNDQQWYFDWAPTVLGEDYPTSDVTSPDDWAGTGDATNLFNNINDDPYNTATFNSVAATTLKKELLLGWANIGTLGASPVVVLATGEGDSNPVYQFIAKQGSNYKRFTTFTLPTHGGNNGSVAHGVFLLDPDAATWTEALVDSADFGMDKAASASLTAKCSELWRYVLHGGNNVPPPPTATPRSFGAIF